jgi:putative ABC transport system permease protein
MLTVVTPTLQFGGIGGNFEAGASRTVMASGEVMADQNAMQTWNDYGFPGQARGHVSDRNSADSALSSAPASPACCNCVHR